MNDQKLKILEYVESRMSFIAPNLSLVVGPTVAAKLMGMKVLYECDMYNYCDAYCKVSHSVIL